MPGDTVTVQFAPGERRVAVPTGTTLLRAAQQSGQEIVATCGARGRCRSCRVQIVAGPTPPATLADRVQLGDDEVRERYRLACQTEAWDDLSVVVAPIFEETSFQILADTSALRSAAGFTLDSGVRKEFVTPTPPSSEEHQDSDLEALLRTLDGAITDVSVDALRRLPALLRSAPGVTVAVFDRTLLGIESGDTRRDAYGVGFDVGTTTVVGYLIDLLSGTVAATASGLNPQAAFGGDLMSRIAFAQEGPANVRQLHTRIIQSMNSLIDEACERAGVTRDRIYKAAVVGNTVMHHLVLGIDPTFVGQAPYAPSIRRSIRVAASDVGLRLNPPTPVFLLPIVAGFVGADALAMILSTRIYESREPRIAVDIGTNGEVLLGSRERLWACSAPAGPALEGAQIRHGMRGAQGEIHAFRKGQDSLDGHAAKESLEEPTVVMALDVVASGFEERAVLDAAGTGGLAGAAAEAKVDVAHGGVGQRQAAVLERAHEVDSAAGRVVLVAGLQVGRARGKAEAAVDAGKRLVVIEEACRSAELLLGAFVAR